MSAESSTPPELLPCPFCGTAPVEDRIEPHKHYIAQMPDYPGSWSIECVKCEFRIFDHDARENAVRKWNTRQTRSESGQGTPEGRGSSLAGALADGSPLGSTPEAKAGSAVPAGAAGTPRWREKDPDSGDDLIELWMKRPRYSNEYAAAEIIEWLERELAQRNAEVRALHRGHAQRDAAQSATAQTAWVSVADRLPEVGGTYLVGGWRDELEAFDFSFARFFIFEDGPRWAPDTSRFAITHWADVPPCPVDSSANSKETK